MLGALRALRALLREPRAMQTADHALNYRTQMGRSENSERITEYDRGHLHWYAVDLPVKYQSSRLLLTLHTN